MAISTDRFEDPIRNQFVARGCGCSDCIGWTGEDGTYTDLFT